MNDMQTNAKLQALEELLHELAPVAIGFSGGVDSTFLAAVCARAIPGETLLVHLDSPFVATPERTSFGELAISFNLPVLTVPFDPFAEKDVVKNAPDRCYQCKWRGFSRIVAEAAARGIASVLDGSNADDAAATDRPGTHALRELGVRSPLMETGWTKAEEREMLRAWGYRIWNLPAGACLATRVATGEPLAPEKIEAARSCEDYLHGCGCTLVRARIAAGELHVEGSAEDLARIAVRTGEDTSAAARAGASDTPGAQVPRAAAGESPERTGWRLREGVLHELAERAAAHGIGHVSPVAHLYRRGSMNA